MFRRLDSRVTVPFIHFHFHPLSLHFFFLFLSHLLPLLCASILPSYFLQVGEVIVNYREKGSTPFYPNINTHSAQNDSKKLQNNLGMEFTFSLPTFHFRPEPIHHPGSILLPFLFIYFSILSLPQILFHLRIQPISAAKKSCQRMKRNKFVLLNGP